MTALRTDFTDASTMATDHPAHHNALATAVNALTTRSTATYVTTGSASGFNYLGTITMATGYRILAVQTSAAARVRLYTDAASQTADQSRAVTTAESDNAGLVMEYLTVNNTVQKVAPAVLGYSMETTPSAVIPITVTPTFNNQVTVTITYEPAE